MKQTAVKSERRISGLAVSHGIGAGRVVFYEDDKFPTAGSTIETGDIDAEVARLRSAVDVCVRQLTDLIEDTEPSPQDSLANIFSVHLLIVEESSLIKRAESLIEENMSAELALRTVCDQYSQKQGLAVDSHLREKQLDIEDVCTRILAILDGSGAANRKSYAGAIVVARELRPSAIIELKGSKPAGLVTERGGWTSHASILAREFMIPMVSGVNDLDNLVAPGDNVIVDGETGVVIIGPDGRTTDGYTAIERLNGNPGLFENGEKRPLTTLDGIRMTIRANVDFADAYHYARRCGAEGIGLFRSESLILRPRRIPSEEEQFKSYRHIADAAGDDGVRIRTFDVESDYLTEANSDREINPSLGLRSIRLSLHEQEFFRSQIRAILRASSDRRIDILLPMVSGVSEVIRATRIIDEERTRLGKDGIQFGTPAIGAMIEVPSGVFTSREIARKVDFLALGTNDLVQYLLAVDRDNEAVAEWYQTLHPAVIRAIGEVVVAASSSDIPMLVCGEMAGSAFYVPLLIGLGVRELSMNINSVNTIRRLIAGITLTQASELVKLVKTSETAEETEDILRNYYMKHWADLFPPGLLATKHR